MALRDQFSLPYLLNQDTGENHTLAFQFENVRMSQLARDHQTLRINASMVIQIPCVLFVKTDTPQPTRIPHVNAVSRVVMLLDFQL